MVQTAGSNRRLHRWAIVLAAGEGRRLQALTTTMGGAVPKQFCSLWGGRPLLHDALQRAQRAVARERVCTVVAAAHRQWWSVPLWALPASNTIVQHQDRGTAVGVLLPLLHILNRDPDALVLLLPSDHHVSDEVMLASAMREAQDQAARARDRVVLLGVRPDEPSPELGYIVPTALRPGGAVGVAEFVEKPSPALASELLERGALWNTFIVAASASALLQLYRSRYADLVERLQWAVSRDAGSPQVGEAAARAYADLPVVDFSRDLLHGQESCLSVVSAQVCGWTDLGCPAAVSKVVRRSAGPRAVPAGPWSIAAAPVLAQRIVAADEEA